MTRIVTSTYRYKRPPRKRKAVAIEEPAIVRKRGRADAVVPPDRVEEPTPGNDNRPEASTSSDAATKSAIVTIKRKSRFGDAPDLTPEEHQRRGEAADALWRGLVDQATAKDGKSAAVSAEPSSPTTKPPIVVTARKRRSDAPHLPMELPLSRKPIERDAEDYKRLKAAMVRRLRGADE